MATFQNCEKDVTEKNGPKNFEKSNFSINTIQTGIIDFKSRTNFLKGLFCALFSAFCFSLSGVLNRKAIFFTGSELTAIRYLMQLILMLLIARYNNIHIFGPKEQRKILALRGCVGAISFISLSFSLKFIDPSDTQALFNTRIIIISILARIFLKEKLTIIHIFCLFLTIFGVAFISQPSFLINQFLKNNFTKINITNNEDKSTNLSLYLGFSLGILGACGASCVAILVKKLSDLNVHYSINVAFSCYIGLPVSLLISLLIDLTGNRKTGITKFGSNEELAWQIFYSLLSALTGCLHQIFITLSNRYDDASKLAVFSTTDLIWAFLLQYFFLNIKANLFSITGATLIFSSCILNIIFKIIGQDFNLKQIRNSNLKQANQTS